MTIPGRLGRLSGDTPKILPSLLRCDFANLANELEALAAAGVEAFHLDVMDGHFVPNLTYGLPIVAAARQATELPLDVHLMVEQPHRYIDAFCDAGADGLTVHIESVEDPTSVLDQIRQKGMVAGLALNPATPLSRIEPFLEYCDLVLVMSVPPGFGGQSFEPNSLEKLKQLKTWTDATDVVLEVDGGIGQKTIESVVTDGAQWLVVGSAIFNERDYGPIIGELTATAEAAYDSRPKTKKKH